MSVIKKVKHHFNRYWFELLWAMTEKEIKARYKHAIFGFLWVVLNPLFQMVVIGVVFSFFIKVSVGNYFLFLFSGLLPWQFFSLSLNQATTSIVAERNLLQKAKFPHELIPLSVVVVNFLHFGVAYSLFLGVLLILGQLNFGALLLMVLGVILLAVFTIGSSLLTSSLHVKYRDTKFIVQAGLLIWFYATPILYHLRLLPPHLRQLLVFNPLTVTFELFHAALVDLEILETSVVLISLLLLALTLFLGVTVFGKLHKSFVDWL